MVWCGVVWRGVPEQAEEGYEDVCLVLVHQPLLKPSSTSPPRHGHGRPRGCQATPSTAHQLGEHCVVPVGRRGGQGEDERQVRRGVSCRERGGQDEGDGQVRWGVSCRYWLYWLYWLSFHCSCGMLC